MAEGEHADPARQGERIAWSSLPEQLRAAVAQGLAGAVVRSSGLRGGFSPGAAERLELADGRRYFLKAVGTAQNPDSVRFYRREIEVNHWLPRGPWSPELRWSYADDDWVALAFDYVDAPTPPIPWRDDDLDTVLAALREAHTALTPAPAAAPSVAHLFAEDFGAWRRWAAKGLPPGADAWARRHLTELADLESGWVAAAAGDTLLHADLRHDNLLLRGRQVSVVDWPWACRGAAWVDIAFFAQSVTLHGGPPPAEVLRRYGDPPDEAALVSVVAAVAGYFVEHAARPAPAGLPHLRRAQQQQAAQCRRWLDSMLGW